MSNLYKKALVIMPDKTKVTIQQLIDTVTLAALTPEKLQWVELMVKAQFENDNASDCITIKDGMTGYVYRQIVHYAIDAMIGDRQ